MQTQRPKIRFDRVLPRELMRRRLTIRSAGCPRAIAPIGKKWMNGVTLRIRFMGGITSQQETVKTEPR